MSTRLGFWLIAGSLLSSVASARIATYVESPTSPENPNQIALGFPVPIPRDQSAPFAGFRSLNGLRIRALELSQAENGPRLFTLGQSRNGQDISMLCFGPDQTMQVLQSAAIHAREWAAPEALMGLAEAFVLQRDQPLIAWVADTIPSCLIPVLNPDGFAQTQNEAAQTRICEAPEQPGDGANCPASDAYPRDGRMRRKNLGDVSVGTGSDGDITTPEDSLLGVDLNRNFPPYWATSNSSSNSKVDIIYHGPESASEPETTILVDLQNTLPTNQLRLFVDTHSYGHLYFWNCTGRRDLDQTTNDWIERFRNAARLAYASSPTGNPNTGAGCGEFGIGAADELFAYQANTPAYTLELEPNAQSGAGQYGGLGVNHDGFILPESIVPLMRDDVVRMMVLAYSLTAGPAWARSVNLHSADQPNTPLYQAAWLTGPTTRQLQTATRNTFQPGDPVTIEIDFDRPMRALDDADNVTLWPGQSLRFSPRLRLQSGDSTWQIDTDTGYWTQPPQGYQTQRFVVTTEIPPSWDPDGELRLLIDATDNAGVANDADPATVPQWANGHFSKIETGDDTHHVLALAAEAPADSGGSGGSLGSGLLLGLGLLKRRRLVYRARREKQAY